MRVVLLRSFWGHRPGSKGFIDKSDRLRLKGSPAAILYPQDSGSLFRAL